MPQNLTEKDYREMALSRDCEWISYQVPSAKQNTLWKCVNGHIFLTSYENMKASRFGCKKCSLNAQSERQRLQSVEYHNLAKELGMKWVGEKTPCRIDTLTNWICPQGHLYKTTYARLKQYKVGGRGVQIVLLQLERKRWRITISSQNRQACDS